jgi:hypothetical protein
VPNNFHENEVAKAQARLRKARADYSYYASCMDWSDREAAKHLEKLDREMREAEDKLNDAQHALRGFQAMQRAVALGM